MPDFLYVCVSCKCCKRLKRIVWKTNGAADDHMFYSGHKVTFIETCKSFVFSFFPVFPMLIQCEPFLFGNSCIYLYSVSFFKCWVHFSLPTIWTGYTFMIFPSALSLSLSEKNLYAAASLIFSSIRDASSVIKSGSVFSSYTFSTVVAMSSFMFV